MLSTSVIGGTLKVLAESLMTSSTSLGPAICNFLKEVPLLELSLDDTTISLCPAFLSVISRTPGSTGFFRSKSIVETALYCAPLPSAVISGSSSLISLYTGFNCCISMRSVNKSATLFIILVLDFSCPNPLIFIEYFFPLFPTGYIESISSLPYPASVR